MRGGEQLREFRRSKPRRCCSAMGAVRSSFAGRLSVVVQNGRVLKSGYELFRQPTVCLFRCSPRSTTTYS
jgi:hypothetical protein